MIINRWNAKTHKDEEYEVPVEWKVLCYSDNMEEVCNCVSCGKEMTFGEGYTSHQYMTPNGMGYCECKECYEKYLPIYLNEHKYYD